MLYAADCAAIKQLKLPETTITMAERVTSGDLEWARDQQAIA